MEKKHTAFSLLEYEEIIGRYIAITSKFEGPSCFPVKISFDSMNMSEPPTITVTVQEVQRTGKTKELFYCAINQNTSIDSFLETLSTLRIVTERILKSIQDNVPYGEIRNQEEQIESDDNPF